VGSLQVYFTRYIKQSREACKINNLFLETKANHCMGPLPIHRLPDKMRGAAVWRRCETWRWQWYANARIL